MASGSCLLKNVHEVIIRGFLLNGLDQYVTLSVQKIIRWLLRKSPVIWGTFFQM